MPLLNALFIYSSEKREEKEKLNRKSVFTSSVEKHFFLLNLNINFFLYTCWLVLYTYIFPFVRSLAVFILSQQALCISHHQIFLFIAFPLQYFAIYFLLTVQCVCVCCHLKKDSASFSSVRLILLAERQWLVVYFIGKLIPILK